MLRVVKGLSIPRTALVLIRIPGPPDGIPAIVAGGACNVPGAGEAALTDAVAILAQAAFFCGL